MACNIIEGYAIACRDSIGGIKTIYAAQFEHVSNFTESSGVATAVSMVGSNKFWIYNMEKENAEMTETEQNSVENGTLFWEQNLSFTLKKLTAAQRNNMKVLAQNRLVFIVLDNNGNYWVLGRHNGLDKVGTNDAKSGKALADMSGYDLAFMGKETNPMYSFTGTVPTS